MRYLLVCFLMFKINYKKEVKKMDDIKKILNETRNKITKRKKTMPLQ